MKVVGHGLGRVVTLYPGEEIRPIAGWPLLDAISAIKERYGFAQVPNLNESLIELEQKGYQFAGGKVAYNGREYAVNEFVIYNDGMSVSSSVTQIAEIFLSKFMDWATENYGVRSFSHSPTKIYRSQVTVGFAEPLSNILKGFDKFSKAVSAELNACLGIDSPVDLVRFAVGVEETGAGRIGYTPFTLERRIHVGFEEEWYFSEAPLPSDVHLKLLEELEMAVSKSDERQ